MRGSAPRNPVRPEATAVKPWSFTCRQKRNKCTVLRGHNKCGIIFITFMSILNINWAVPTWDMFIVLFFFVAAFLYGFSLGRDRVIVVLVSLYMSLAVVNYAPFIKNLNPEINIATSLFAFKISAFLGIFLALFFFLSRSAILHSLARNSPPGQWWQVLLFSVLHTGLLVSIILSFLPADIINHLSPATQYVFTSEFGRFLWITLPILAMVGLT